MTSHEARQVPAWLIFDVGRKAMELPLPPVGYERRMQRFAEETCLRDVGQDEFGRIVYLADDAADAWQLMRRAAADDGMRLLLLSGFRSIIRQSEIVRAKITSGQSLDVILSVSAYPGFSEHHTGRAIDVGSPHREHFTEAFETTREFLWLSAHAGSYGFRLSYPRSNASGIVYEPWHWYMAKPKAQQGARANTPTGHASCYLR